MKGIINVYKEKDFTSHDVVAKLRGILKTKKIGHTGTLDPDATGVLPVCIGKATKVCDLLTDKDKTYKAVVKLGVVTDTLDMTGQILEEKSVDVTKQQIELCLKKFEGTIMQTPPMYSAIKVNGKKLYELARKGESIERKQREVTINSLKLISIDLSKDEFEIEVDCSKGTYIRSLCDDIGRELGTGAAMKALIRTKVGRFTIDKAYKLDEIEKLRDEDRIDKILMPVDLVFDQYKKVVVNEDGLKLLLNGNKIPMEFCDQEFDEGTKVKMYDDNDEFYAIYEVVEGKYKVVKMFH